MARGPKILAGCGCALFGLSFLGLLVAVLAPVVNAPRTSWEEAIPAIIGGAMCSLASLLPLGGGIVWLFIAKRKSS